MTNSALERQVQFLSRVPLLHGFDRPLLELLAGIMSLTRVQAGENLCHEGGPGDACFIIGNGRVEVLSGHGGKEKRLCELGPGHCVGEVALIDGKRRSATVRCVTDISLFTLQRDDFERLWHAGNRASMRLLDNIATNLAGRVRQVNESYASIFSQAGETIASLSEHLALLQAAMQGSEEEDAAADVDLLAIVNYQGGKVPSSR